MNINIFAIFHYFKAICIINKCLESTEMYVVLEKKLYFSL